MNAFLELEQSPLASTDLAALRHFALQRISYRLATEPGLVASFWNEIGATAEQPPNLTVIYCALRRMGHTYALLEFVAGETLEELVKRTDPAACELEIPLFCKVLDSFEDSCRSPIPLPAAKPGLELLDYGVARASGALTSKMHGAVVAGPDRAWNDCIFGEYGASRAQVFAALMELCGKLPGDLPRTQTYGPSNIGAIHACSLSAPPAPDPPAEVRRASEKAAAAAPPPQPEPVPVARDRSPIRALAPYLIALATTALVLMTFYGMGGYLAKRSVPPDAGKLMLAPMPPEPPVQAADAQQPEVPLVVVTPSLPPPAKAAGKRSQDAKKRVVKQPVPSIVLSRGARPLRQTSLEYPAEAWKEHITGVVEMQLTIAEDGSVQSPRVLSGDPLLRAGLTEEVSHWVYQPLRVNGKPVPMTTELAIKFNLN